MSILILNKPINEFENNLLVKYSTLCIVLHQIRVPMALHIEFG